MFRTELTIAPSAQQFSRTARVLTIGSCFAESIGARLAANKVETLANPFGTVFQPLILGQLLRAAAGEEMDWQQHITEARGRWQSYDLHSSIGAASPVELLQYIQQLAQQVGDFVRRADLVVLTLGTAWAYRLRETGELVNNCHKQPADLFHKELLTPDEIINALAETHAYLRRINPELKFVLTISPVRHIKDTLPLNAVSKSVLRVACHYLSELLPGVAYFPAFELLMDDLRDYRFYASDMLHPSEVAEDYIWDKFARTYFDVDFGRFRKEWASVRQSLTHRPLHDGAPEHRQFLEATRERLQRLAGQQVDVAAELQDVEQRIAALPVPLVIVEPEIEDDGEERIDVGGVETAREIATEADATLQVATETVVAATPPARLSPEEFRSQRNRDRDRRGRNDRRNRDERALQPTPAVEAAEVASAQFEVEEEAVETTQPLELAEDTASAFQVLGLGMPSAAQTTVDASPVLPDNQPKKKKRRSRGGAKRTARKHAARLAAEGIPADGIVADATVVGTTEEVVDFATPTSAIEMVEPVAAVELPEAAQSVTTVAETLPEVPTTTIGIPDANPQWNSRREGKKSTVIQKSTPVKRGGRRVLFNTPAVADSSIVEAAPVVAPPLPELPAVPTIVATPELPVIEMSVTETEALGGAAPATVAPPTAQKSRNRNRGKGNKPAVATAVPEAAAATVAVTDTPPATPAFLETPASPKPGDNAAPPAPAATRRKAPKKPAVPVAPAVAAAPAPEPATAATPAPVNTTPAPAAEMPAAKPARVRPSRSKVQAVSATPAEPVATEPAAPPLPAAPARPSRSRAAKPAVASPIEPAIEAPAKPRAKVAPKTSAATKPVATKPKPAGKTTKKA
ncbi:GSCFA domain-containing protein [Hymenobacter sp. ASUV-10]|uniref:GSCFA domain-containing protein n=1 Tax=Hymenobacter aranciens TaxID=3063996 RepID=A0ABT9BF54_9BACT|nr:GSCFA domain-containing protein [Hymenobacter sp. ASUV-10]MDO7876905.1 GSCFA domain-containing protein [Hymenobacter sp. ASUV-10]